MYKRSCSAKQIAFIINHVLAHLGMHVHRGTLTHKQGCTDADSCMQTQTQTNTYSYKWGHKEGKYKKRQTWPNYFLLFLPLSVSSSNTPVAFNLAFILPHSQYHPQSVSTLQHSPCVSHLSLSQLLTLFFPSSDTQTVKQKARFWARD